MSQDSPLLTIGARQARLDLEVVASFIPPRAKVLDVGCGDGLLLEQLANDKQVDGRGIELSQRGVNECVARGLSVIQGDADTDLVFYPDRGFDFVILSQTLQATKNPRDVLEHLLRIGERVIVSIPNFGYWQNRVALAFKGQMPVNRHLPYSWYDTPNIHFCTIRDFVHLCDEVGAKVESAAALDGSGQKIGLSMPWWFWNFFGQQAVFLLKR
jgi:methionine biosynthesis protein MetW